MHFEKAFIPDNKSFTLRGQPIFCLVSKLLTVFLLLMAVNAEAQSFDDLKVDCLKRVNSGSYGSGIRESVCMENFDLPSPFLIKCLRLQDNHSAESIDHKSCTLFFQDNDPKAIHRAWGPWQDYSTDRDLPADLRETFRTARAQRVH